MKVFKIGGNVVDDERKLETFCEEFASLQGPRVLVHGGGVAASSLERRLGHEPVMIEGRRVTDSETLKTVTMMYAGWCNKHICALLQSRGCNAIGLAGCDGSAITARRRPPLLLSDGVTEVDYGYVGDVTPASVNVGLIKSLCSLGLVPVFSAINHDGHGELLNTNADTVAMSIAAALNAELLYCFEKNGVLCDGKDGADVIPHIGPAEFARLKAAGTIAGGMIPKIENSLAALRNGAISVVIRSSSGLLEESGTRLTLDD